MTIKQCDCCGEIAGNDGHVIEDFNIMGFANSSLKITYKIEDLCKNCFNKLGNIITDNIKNLDDEIKDYLKEVKKDG